MLQLAGTNLCGYYICDYIYNATFSKDSGYSKKDFDVRKQHYSQFCVEFHSYIYMHVLTPFFKLALGAGGRTPTTRSHKNNSRGIGGILS